MMLDCADDPAFNSVDKAVLKAAYSGVVAFILEAAKHDVEADGIMYVSFTVCNGMCWQ